MKRRTCRGPTVDRIEVTWNRYYSDTPLLEKCISEITENDIMDFFTDLLTKNGSFSPKEWERVYQIMNNVLVYMRDRQYQGVRLYDWKRIQRNIPHNRITEKRKHEYALSKTTVSVFLDAVLVKDIYPLKRCAALCLCLNFYLGLRIGELAALQFSDFDLQKKVLTVTRTESKVYERDADGNKTALTYQTGDPKTMEGCRRIPLLPEAVYIYEAVKMHHQTCGYYSPFLVFDGSDTIRIRSLDRTLRRLCSLIGIAPFNSHVIRKTFATRLHNANVPTRVIADLMGHAEIGTTEHYYILSFKEEYAMYYAAMKDGLTYN